MYELPPILKGDEQEQLRVLRDYLVRMARDLDENVEKAVVNTVSSEVKRAVSGGTGYENGPTGESDETKRLRSLIIKTSDTVKQQIDMITTTLETHSEYISQFGTITDNLKRQIIDTASGTQELYDSISEIVTDNSKLLETMQGEIRRGYIEDPDNPGSYILGIAIAQNIQFDNTEITENAVTYYHIQDKQTFGLYSSSGWSFWLGGVKVGWFKSGDSSLNVRNISIQQTMTLGDGWLFTMTGGLGIRYVGTPT